MVLPDQTPTTLWERIKSKVRRTVRDWRRSRLRKRILALPPSPVRTEKQSFGLHMLLCHRDIEMGLCAAKSFVLANHQAFHFVFHEDGTLTASDKQLVLYHFPQARLISRIEADREINKTYAEYSALLSLRKRYPCALKIVDVYHYATQERIVFFDPDIVFFEEPVALLATRQNVFNKDLETAYIASPEEMEEAWKIPIIRQLNSGLWQVSRNLLDLKLANDILASPEYPALEAKRKYVAEQTLIAIMASVHPEGMEFLPESYDVSYSKPVNSSPCKHYVGRIRHGFEIEGLTYLLHEKQFEKNWKAFIKSVQ